MLHIPIVHTDYVSGNKQPHVQKKYRTYRIKKTTPLWSKIVKISKLVAN